MTAYEIPLQSTPQQLSISLAGVAYQLTVSWNWPGQCWVLDIADASGNPFVCGIPLVTGADLLSQYAYLGIGGSLVVQTDSDVDAMPTFDNLGQQSHLYFVTS